MKIMKIIFEQVRIDAYDFHTKRWEVATYTLVFGIIVSVKYSIKY